LSTNYLWCDKLVPDGLDGGAKFVDAAIVGEGEVGGSTFFLDGPLGGFAAGELGFVPAALAGAGETSFARGVDHYD
jgi:hypothetical protein